VVNREGVHMGRVTDLMATGPTSVLVIQASDPTDDTKSIERMIPFVDAYVDAVDTAARRITVDWQLDY
jgi:16S rRNA processing protein RimM